MGGLEPLTFLALGGLAGGLVLFVRGMLGYRTQTQVAGIGTSSIGSLAAGEVRLCGTVQPGVLSLVSLLQGRTCVYYNSRITESHRQERRTVFERQRAVEFLLDDGTGTIRVFPQGAAWDLSDRFHESDGLAGDPPPGLDFRSGPETVVSEVDPETAIANLLTVHPPQTLDGELSAGGFSPLGAILGGGMGGGIGSGIGGIATGDGAGIAAGIAGGGRIASEGLLAGGGRREYREKRLEPGDTVTIIGFARPFADIPDPLDPDGEQDPAVGGPLAALDDPEIAADLAAARASGRLAADPEQAWGNAAIPGFGIGRPVRAPVLDPAATPASLAEPVQVERARRLFDIAPETLVLAGDASDPLRIFEGTPSQAASRAGGRFILGLAGAILAIGSAVLLALIATGSLGRLAG